MPRQPASVQSAAAQTAAAADGIVRFYNFLLPGNSFRDDLLAGLAGPVDPGRTSPRSIAPRWHFNEAGLALHRARAASPAWYQGRDEAAVIQAHLDELAALAGAHAQLIEIGPGAGQARALLAQRLAPGLQVQVDSDPVALTGAVRGLAADCPWLNLCGILADPAAALALPGFAGVALDRKLVLVPAAALASFTPDQLYEVLRNARLMAGAAGGVLATVDLKKDHKQLDEAYNDPEGIGALLQANVLARANAELGADFQVQRFGYRASYDEVRGRVEMLLESRYAQFARVGEARVDFAPGEVLLTGIASLYTNEEFLRLARDAGLVPRQAWADERQHVCLHWLGTA